MAFKGNEYFWKDRKRYLGLPLSFTRYALSHDRLFLSVGFFSVKDDDILLYRIRDISVKRTLWQRLFGVGTVTVQSSDNTHPTLELKSVKNPMQVKETLHDLVEDMKQKRRMRFGEIMGSGYDANELDDNMDE